MHASTLEGSFLFWQGDSFTALLHSIPVAKKRSP